jgi:hypothetical protein
MFMVAAVVSLAAACSGASSVGTHTGSSTSASVSTKLTSSTLQRSSGSDLAALMPLRVPSGFVLQPDNIGDTGPSDLAKAVRDDGSPDAKRVLTHAGFVRGFQRLWVKSGGQDENILFLYQFATPNGANEYVQYSLRSQAGPKVQSFVVPSIPAAHGLKGADQTGSTALILFARGSYVAQAVVNGGANLDQTSLVTTLAMAQYTRLR